MSWGAAEFAEAIGSFRREFAGAIRRMMISRASGGIWQLAGHLLFDVTRRETKEVENYPGIGVYAEPPSTGSPEAIAVQAGGPNNPAIVGARDEATRAKVADVAGVGDTFVGYNSASRVWVKPDGTIEARTHAGTARSLAREDEFAAIVNILSTWTPVAGDGGAALKVAINAYLTANPGAPHGTTKLKGE